MIEANFAELLPLLAKQGVDYILIGGGAGIVHGLARTTYVDVVYSREPENQERLVKAISSVHPYLRGAPPGLPFHFDLETVQRGLNFTLTTDLGNLDLLGEVAGNGTYESLLPYSMIVNIYETECRVVKLEKLIQLKRAAGRPKDLEIIAELETLLAKRNP